MNFNKKGQGAFEYLLLIGGVLFLAVAVIMILRTGVLATGQETLGNATQQFNNTLWCMTYCDIGGQRICNGECTSTGSYYCRSGVSESCSNGCTPNKGCN